MERITAKEAEQFVPLKNDMKSDLGDVAYFTLTPSDRGEGWEDILTTYLAVKECMKVEKVMETHGFMCYLTNLSQECIKLVTHHMKM